MTDSFICPCCGQAFDDMPLDIGFKRPEPYLRVPEEERKQRCKVTSDFCVIDDCNYFIRGFLPVPIPEVDDVFGWGYWCKVAEEDYQRYLKTASPGSVQGPAFAGYLANAPAGYDGVEGLPVSVQPVSPDDRPTLSVEPSDHLLYREQKQGITMKRVHEINATMFPGQF